MLKKILTILRTRGPRALLLTVRARLHETASVNFHAAYNVLRLAANVRLARGAPLVHSPMKALYKGAFRITGLARVGYAARSIALAEARGGKRFLVTADVGDDALSIVPVERGGLRRRLVVQFPRRSAPIGAQAIRLGGKKEDGDGLLVAVFNFDEEGEHEKETYVCLFRTLDDLLAMAQPGHGAVAAGPGCEKIIKREGHWGFRSVACHMGSDGTGYVATVDRSRDALYVLEAPEGGSAFAEGMFRRVDLGYESGSAEPVSVAIVPQQDRSRPPRFCVSQRSRPDLTIVSRDRAGRYDISARIPIDGASRSSVAAGRFVEGDRFGVAIALWGEDPRKINTVTAGKACLLLPDDADGFRDPVYVDAGIHPTDVVAGDFDGDGIDELAVLNYGSGISPVDRIDPGGVQIFKWFGDMFRMISEIRVPYPRIGLSADIDGDGKDELIASLFFEKRLVVIKHEGG